MVNSRQYTAGFNFKGTDQQARIGGLSGGERNRVHLAKLLRSGGNLLLLDEPTNDLDVDTLRALEDALEAFPGCAVIISHDRWFLDRVATHVLAFEGDSQVTWFEGNFEAYEEHRRERCSGRPPTGPTGSPTSGSCVAEPAALGAFDRDTAVQRQASSASGGAVRGRGLPRLARRSRTARRLSGGDAAEGADRDRRRRRPRAAVAHDPLSARAGARPGEHPHRRRARRALAEHAVGADGAGRLAVRARARGLLRSLERAGDRRDRRCPTVAAARPSRARPGRCARWAPRRSPAISSFSSASAASPSAAPSSRWRSPGGSASPTRARSTRFRSRSSATRCSRRCCVRLTRAGRVPDGRSHDPFPLAGHPRPAADPASCALRAFARAPCTKASSRRTASSGRADGTVLAQSRQLAILMPQRSG